MSEDGGVAVRHSSESSDHFTPPFIVEAARATLGAIDFDPFSNSKANEIVRATKFYNNSPLSGFTSPWEGRVFVNPPGGKCDNFGRPVIAKTKYRGPCTVTGDCGLPPGHRHVGNDSSQKLAWQKLMTEVKAERVQAAIFICFSVELLQTSQVNPNGFVPLDWPICYPSRRVAYMKPDGTIGGSPPHASCVVLVPPPPGVGGQPWVAHTQPLRSMPAATVNRFKAAFAGIGKVVVPA